MSTALTKLATDAAIASMSKRLVRNQVRSVSKQVLNKALNTALKRASAIRTIKRARPARRGMGTTRYRYRRNKAPVSFANGFGAKTLPVRIQQSEYVADIYTIQKKNSKGLFFWPWQDKDATNPQSFDVAAFPLNPANPSTFPWLSNIAKLFDKYKFNSLKFTFVNSVSTVTDGEVAMAVDFDTLDKEPQNMVALSQLSQFESFAPFNKREFSVQLNHGGQNKYLFTYDESSEKNDLKTYNMGTLFVGTQGCAKGTTDNDYYRKIGRLIVDYDVTLLDKSYVSPSARVSALEQFAGSFEQTTGSQSIDSEVIGNIDLTNPATNVYDWVTNKMIPKDALITMWVNTYNINTNAPDPGNMLENPPVTWSLIATSLNQNQSKWILVQAVVNKDIPAGTTIYGISTPSGTTVRTLATVNTPEQARFTTTSQI